MIVIFYKMNGHVLPDSSLPPGLVDNSLSIYHVGLAFYKKMLDFHFINNIFMECYVKHHRVSTRAMFLHCITSPCISPQSPVRASKTPLLPSSQPKWLLVHCITSPCISPESPVPISHPLNHSPPSSQPKWLFVHCK